MASLCSVPWVPPQPWLTPAFPAPTPAPGLPHHGAASQGIVWAPAPFISPLPALHSWGRTFTPHIQHQRCPDLSGGQQWAALWVGPTCRVKGLEGVFLSPWPHVGAGPPAARSAAAAQGDTGVPEAAARALETAPPGLRHPVLRPGTGGSCICTQMVVTALSEGRRDPPGW